MINTKNFFLMFGVALIVLSFSSFVDANNYTVDVYFTIPETVYVTNERIELKGFVYLANYSDNNTLITNSSAFVNATVNLTVTRTNGTFSNNYTFTTDSNGAFYSRSDYYASAAQVNAPSSAENYFVRASYIDPNNATWFSQVEISVVNTTIDLIRVRPEKVRYSASERVNLEIEAIRLVGDRILYVSNVSVNGSLRNSTKTILENFSCITGSNGRCITNVTAPSTYGNFILELNNFKAFSTFSVVPFTFSIYMKDELGHSLKNIYSAGEQGRVEVSVANASSSDVYTFSGYIADSSGNVVKSISSTTLDSNNSFTNTFQFNIDAATFVYGAYVVSVTVSKSGDGSITGSASFEVKDWTISMNKKTTESGFEYGYSTFQNKTMRVDVFPAYRINSSVITGINSSAFSVQLKDSLNNVISSENVTWNASCGNEGCYEFSMASPSVLGEYTLAVALSYSGTTQTAIQIINVIGGAMSAQSTNIDGAIKELFGTNEEVYISFTAYNATSSAFNLSDAEIFLVNYMNGSDFSYAQVANFELVNKSNSIYEWAWNSTLQRIKLDFPSYGGIYTIFAFGNNRTVGVLSRFIVNPYEVCTVAKDTPGQVSSGNYYVWQFKTTDTVYFEHKVIQANNPLGRAGVSNFSSGNSTGSGYGKGSQCSVNTATQQVVNNATITISEVRNMESGELQTINSTESTCQTSDSSGGYSCTVKPLTSWDGGVNIIKFDIEGQDGSSDIVYGKFEARAFYLYGWSNTWQNSPTSNISLNVRLYEAGSGWWGSSGGLSGTITLKKVEYQGRDGEWIWPPTDSGYNASVVNSSSVTSGSGTLSLPANLAKGGSWKTGYYRALIQGTTSDGDTDYGYAWFGVKLWDVYGQPVECTSSTCNYKSYFNSKENITLYVKISQAGDYSYSYQGGQNIYGNVSIGVKKIEDCRTWPCKELNSSKYQANTIIVNESSPWYWNANLNNQSKYLLRINTTTGTWGTGWYNVVLDVNGTDTGNAWFNTIAFYADTRPTNINGTNWKYSIKPGENMYYNVTTTKNYKGWNVINNDSDYVNATIDDAVLRAWDYTTQQSREYNYPEDINASLVNKTNLLVVGNALVNLSYRNGSWPSGYYWGELTLRNTENETSTGWLWFSAKPFRVSTSTNTYNIDNDQCVNTSLNIYEPDWSNNALLYGNYSITNVYENVWSGSSNSQVSYTNYTSGSFNATGNLTVCPNNGAWGSGSWGGYHYLNIVVKDNSNNDSETGWLSFKAVPFSVSWGSVSGGTNKLTSQNVVVPVTLTKYSTGVNTTGNLTRVYQWRYDSSYNGMQDYIFSVGNCYSNVSGQCTVNGTQNVAIYPPSTGWRVGYNYLYAVWTKTNDASSKIEDWSGVYIEGREPYNGYYSNSDSNGNWKYNFGVNDNITIKVNVRDNNYNSVNVNLTNVQYATSGNCWGEWCRSYTSATWSLISGGVQTSNGNAIITIAPPSGGWSNGYYYIKTSVSGGAGTASITGGEVRVKDSNGPNITISSPTNNQTISNATFSFSATTTENSQCYLSTVNYNTFNGWYCGGVISNSTNSSNSTYTSQTIGACNTTLYGYNGTSNYNEYISSSYRSVDSASGYTWSYASTGFTTGGTTHTYTFNASSWTTQHYGTRIYCYDSDDNYATELVAFKVNVTTNESTTAPLVTINKPDFAGINYSTSSAVFNATINKNGTCLYTLNNGTINNTMQNNVNRNFNATNSSIADGQYTVRYYCNDTFGNWNRTESRIFGIDTAYPLISYGSGTSIDYANLTQNWIYVNVSVTESNFGNITFLLKNSTATVNSTTFTTIIYVVNWTGLAYTNYTYNVSLYDSAGNFNSTSTRYANLSAG